MSNERTNVGRSYIQSVDNTDNVNRKMKTVSVAILSSDGFDAFADVDQATLTFGATGNEASFKSCARKAKYVNEDNLKDLVCTFVVKKAFPCDSGVGILKGQTKAEIPTPFEFEGYQEVAISPSLPICTP